MENIELKGYKSFKDMNLQLRKINILIGANGAGKSNFLSFFEFLNAAYERRLKEFVALAGGTDRFLFEGSKVTSHIEAKMRFGSNSYSLDLVEGTDKFVFAHEKLGYSNYYTSNTLDINNFGDESALKFYNGLKRGDYIKGYVSGIKKYHFHDTGKQSPFTKSSNVDNDGNYLYSKGENLAAFLYNIREKAPKSYKRIIRVIQSVAPYFNDFYLVPNTNGLVRLQWKDKFSDMTYGPTDLSDGTIRFVALATLFLQPELPEVIIIDEPELGLHPFAIEKLSGLIHYAEQMGKQVIIATQSAQLISFFEPEDVVTVNQVDGETMMRRLDNDELTLWLVDYSLGDMWQQNLFKGGQPA